MKSGHRRPAGTVARIRLVNADSEPELDGLVYDEPFESHRGYRIVGVEEVARPGRWNLLLERMDWPAWNSEVAARLDAGRVPIAFGLVTVQNT